MRLLQSLFVMYDFRGRGHSHQSCQPLHLKFVSFPWESKYYKVQSRWKVTQNYMYMYMFWCFLELGIRRSGAQSLLCVKWPECPQNPHVCVRSCALYFFSKFAITKDQMVHVYYAPGKTREYNPFTLYRTYYGAYDETLSIDWTSDSKYGSFICKCMSN